MNFVTQTIRSKYLEKNFEVSCWEMTQKNGRTLTIVEHAAIEDIILNKVDKEGFTYELEALVGVTGHPVFKCTMQDGYMRKIIAIGEAEPSTLINNISRQNPAIMASNRAFDRAAIRYLDFEGDKVFSSTEIAEDEENCDNQDTNFDPTGDISYDENAEQKETLFNANNEQSLTVDENYENNNVRKSSKENYGTVIVNFGKYRGQNKSVAEICATDESWANYAATMNVSQAGETTRSQVNAIKAYLDEQQKEIENG